MDAFDCACKFKCGIVLFTTGVGLEDSNPPVEDFFVLRSKSPFLSLLSNLPFTVVVLGDGLTSLLLTLFFPVPNFFLAVASD